MRRSWLLLAPVIFVLSIAPARAQPSGMVQPLPRSDGGELRRHLSTLAENPRSLEALIGAGRAALRVGDPEAALSFFSRADEVANRDARVKAGMASALARLGQPAPALELFAEAAALGAADRDIAADRGLAHDLGGDPRRAQQDYFTVLRHGDDAELRRRLALSLAISGQREAALRLLDSQLRTNDRAAWRAQAFVLALTGDTAGAARVAEGVMPAGTAAAMIPFLGRLAALSPADKARAVHLGNFPRPGSPRPAASAVVSADPEALAFALGGVPASAQPPVRNTRTAARAEERRPARSEPRGEPRTRIAELDTRRPPPVTRPAEPHSQVTSELPPIVATNQGARRESVAISPRVAPPAPAPAAPDGPAPAGIASASGPETSDGSSSPAETTGALSTPVVEAAQPQASPAPGFSLEPGQTSPAGTQPAPARAGALADIAELVRALPEEAAPSPAPARTAPVTRIAPQRGGAAPARPVARRPAHPARHWVQVAGGANRAALPREYSRLRGLAPALLGRRTAFIAPLRATNRLLVGPFASEREAQAFVNQLAGQDISAFVWTSAAGEEIAPLPAAR